MNNTKWTLQDLGANRAGYPNWHEYAIRDGKTNVCLAIVGNVDRYFEGDIQRQQAELMAKAPTLLKQRDALREILKRLVDWHDDNNIQSQHGAWPQARAALALCNQPET